MIRTVKKLIPLPIKKRVWAYRENRLKNQLFGKDAVLVPPPALMFDGPQGYEAFKANGDEFIRIYREVCGLRPDERMLDVGSGIGRKTLPLTHYFNGEGRYDGIDPTMAGVEWCNSKITPRYPNFHFQWMDVYNQMYNPTGKTPAAEYRFPFESGSFTFVMLGSVFTHMIPKEIEQYLSEIHRVLRPGGRCLISYFLLNSESLQLIAAGKNKQPLEHRYGDCLVENAGIPELAIAHPEPWVRQRYDGIGFDVKRIGYGSWSGRGDFMSYQDLVLAAKR